LLWTAIVDSTEYRTGETSSLLTRLPDDSSRGLGHVTQPARGIMNSTSSSVINDSVTSITSVFDRYSWVGLLQVHGSTALQVSVIHNSQPLTFLLCRWRTATDFDKIWNTTLFTK